MREKIDVDTSNQDIDHERLTTMLRSRVSADDHGTKIAVQIFSHAIVYIFRAVSVEV